MATYIKVNNVDIHMLFNKGTNGHSIILLHPALAQAVFYMPLIEKLNAAGFTTLAVDFPNHGLSKGESLRTIEEYGDFTEQLVEALQAEGLISEDVNLVGWSMGGTTAYEVATRQPKWLRTVAMLSSSAHWGFDPLPFTQAEYDAGKCDRIPTTTEEEYIRTFLNTAKSMLPPFSSCDGDWNACATYDGRNKASLITVPVYHTWGNKDELGAEEGNNDLKKTLTHGIPDFFEGANHNLPAEHPDEVAAGITNLVLQSVRV